MANWKDLINKVENSLLSPNPVDDSPAPNPVVKPDPLGAVTWEDICKRQDEGPICYGACGYCVDQAHRESVPGPTDADLDRAALARPKVQALVEAAFREGFNSYETPCVAYNDEESAWVKSAALAALPKVGE